MRTSLSRRLLDGVSVVVVALVVAAPAAAGTALRWSQDTGSPRSHGRATLGDDAPLYEACGGRDLGLVKVAAAVVGRRIAGEPAPSEHQLKELTRAAGVPQPWPRAWLLANRFRPEEVRDRLVGWLAKRPANGLLRCGVARGATRDGDPVVAVVTVDVLADQASLPRSVRASQWLSLDAVVHAEADDAKVLLLGPRGRPRRVLASLSNGRVVSRFNLDRPGRWLVQVVAMLPAGPTPVLESVVFADAHPPSALPSDTRAPKHRATAAALYELLNRERKREGLARLGRDPKLEVLALDHARTMALKGRVAHDVGRGLPSERAVEAGVSGPIGENVATAPTLERLHEALWGSPSHRENMLDSGFARVGVAVVRDHRGKLWAAQMYAP